MAEKSQTLSDEQIVSIINSDFDQAVGAPGGEISDERAKAYDYYLQKLFGDEDDEVSEVVTSDVADVVDGIMPSMLRIFTSADNLVSFDPVGPDDTEKAEQASDYVSHIFFKRNDAFTLLHDGCWDALVQKTGIWKAYWDESEEITTENYEGLTEDELLQLAQDDELEIFEREDRVEILEVEGLPPVKFPVTDVRCKRVTKKGRVRVDCIPPNEYRVSADGAMEGHEREITRDELVAMGFSKEKVWELPAVGESTRSDDERARKDKKDDRKSDSGSPDKSQELVLLREGYKKFDVDGDGRAELFQVYTSGDILLQKEPFDRSPFSTICPAPLPHKQVGRSTAEKVMDIQRVNSTILRQTLGNLYHTNNPGHGVWEQGMGENTMDDLLTTKVGRIARFARPVNESYAPITVPFTAGSSFPMLEYFDKMKRDRTGITSDSEGLSPEALKNIQTTVLAQSVDLSKMKIEMIARIFAETGIKSLFRHIHELVLKHQDKPDVVELRGRWVKVDPRSWRHRYDMTVNIGLGIGTREQNLLHLNGIWEKQTQMAQGGGMNLTVTPRNMYNTAAEMVKNANLKLPSMFFTDPGDKLAPPQPDERAQLEKMQAEIKQREQLLDAERQQVKAAELQLKAEEQKLNHAREVAKIEEKMQEREDKYAAQNEELRNKLMEFQLKVQQAEEEGFLKEAGTAADIAVKRANAEKVRAEAENLRKAPPEAVDNPLEAEKTEAEIERTRAQTEKERRAAEKLEAEKRGQEIENRMAEEGIDEILEQANGESEEDQ